jgi:serine/threonine-protein kinase
MTLPQNKDTDFFLYYLDMAERKYQEAEDRLVSFSFDSYETQELYIHKDLALASVYHAKKETPLIQKYAESARITIEKLVRERPQDPRFHVALGRAYAYLGRKDDAIREGQRAVELHPISKDALSGQDYIEDLATIYTLVGEYEDAINQLEYLMSIPAGSLISVYSLKLNPIWDSLREHPRFKQLLEKYSEKGE